MKKTIDNFYKEIEVKKKNGYGKHILFDYDKIWDDEAFLFLIISERGAKGKSTQAKRLARRIYEDEQLKSMWLMNTQKLIDKEKKSHLAKPKQHLKDVFTLDEKVEGDVVLSNHKDKESWYTKFASLSTAENEKGSRDDYGLIIYDEFNVGLSMIRNQQTDLLSSLLGTLSDPVNTGDEKFKKMIIHGNFKSLNNQFLIDLGVTHIDEEVTDIYVGDKLIMRILCPEFNEEDKQKIKDDNKDNPIFLLQQKLGKADHVYFNENLFDRVNNVNDWMISLPILGSYKIKIEKNYYRALIVESGDLGKVIYFIDTERNDEDINIYALDKKSVEENITLNTNLKVNFLSYLSKDKLYFKSAYIRENIIKEITK